MVALPLTSGAYSSQGYIANAQKCLNLYPEKNPEETHPESPVTHYPRPGLLTLSLAPAIGTGRCLYGATTGDLFAVINQNIFYIDPDFKFNLLGTTLTPGQNPVSMADNGQDVLVVDGSANGYNINLATKAFTQIGDPNFLGSTRADFIDSFLILNIPGTNQWYCTLSDQVAFNGLYVGQKTAWPDNILCAVAIEREVWLFGTKKSEVWYNAGTVPFPFQLLPGNIIEQGCAAQYSPAKMDTNVYWLSQSPEGDRMVMRGNNQNVAERISNHAIEYEFRKYARIDDAIGSTYQITGHSFYKLHFPTADKTWGYDEATKQWHEDNSIDKNGVLHRARNTFTAFAYGKNVALDWNNGSLYQIDPLTYTDANMPIICARSFPHVANELKRVGHSSFIADFETGTMPNSGEDEQFLSPWSEGFSSGFGPLTQQPSPVIVMRYSKDGGNTWSNNRVKEMISAGHYRSMLRWRNMGLARDMVYELSWSAPMATALNGAFIDPVPAGS
jgi:hypothetical protein